MSFEINLWELCYPPAVIQLINLVPRSPPLTGRLTLTILLVIGTLACSDGDSPTEPGPPPVDLNQTLETTHFTLRYDFRDQDKINIYASELEGYYDEILENLGMTSLPKTTGHFYPDQRSFTAATGLNALGSVQGPNQFSIVAAPLQRLSLPVHEFVHCATLHRNSSLGSNPVWLWEGVAVYLAEEFVPPRTVPCLAEGHFPTLSDLESRNGGCDIYQVGFTLIEFIVHRWDRETLRELIDTNGDLEGVLGLRSAGLEREWQAYVQETYLP